MTHAPLTNDVGCAVTEKKKVDQPVDLLILPIPDPAILSISGRYPILISDRCTPSYSESGLNNGNTWQVTVHKIFCQKWSMPNQISSLLNSIRIYGGVDRLKKKKNCIPIFNKIHSSHAVALKIWVGR